MSARYRGGKNRVSPHDRLSSAHDAGSEILARPEEEHSLRVGSVPREPCVGRRYRKPRCEWAAPFAGGPCVLCGSGGPKNLFLATVFVLLAMLGPSVLAQPSMGVSPSCACEVPRERLGQDAYGRNVGGAASVELEVMGLWATDLRTGAAGSVAIETSATRAGGRSPIDARWVDPRVRWWRSRRDAGLLPGNPRATGSDERWRSQGFYDTSERMGIGLRLDSARTTFEFTWARLPHRRLSLGLWVEANWLDTHPEQTYASGGGLEVTVFPMLPVAWKPWGLYATAAAGAVQNYTRTYDRRGGEARLYAEAGWFGHSGRRHFLIPKAGVRRTWFYEFRYRKQTGERTEDQVVLGLEVKVRRMIPGVAVLVGDGRRVWLGSLRFAYRDPAPARR